jgi:hypothetical protein
MSLTRGCFGSACKLDPYSNTRYLTPIIWLFFAFLAVFNPGNWSWLLVVAVAVVLNMANVVGYTYEFREAYRV